MHDYLRAIGLSQYTTKKELKELLKDTILHPDQTTMAQRQNQTFMQLEKYFGEDFGICVCGELDNDNRFEMDYYYPIFHGYDVTTYEQPSLERNIEKESYCGLCDDVRVGISIIFFMNNPAEYIKAIHTSGFSSYIEGITLTGLSTKGKILLPINKTEKQKKAEKEAVQQRIQLLSAARQGDEKAIESLTLEDLDTFSMVGRRISKEDILSIVESYFMPRGIECDQYTVLGEILDYRLENNKLTDEQVYIITINCNDIVFDICMNKVDLLGEPMIGRRIKANIWLQGELHFS